METKLYLKHLFDNVWENSIMNSCTFILLQQMLEMPTILFPESAALFFSLLAISHQRMRSSFFFEPFNDSIEILDISGRIHEITMQRFFLRNVKICEIVWKKRESEHMFLRGSKK